jgi:hypothetical protein
MKASSEVMKRISFLAIALVLVSFVLVSAVPAVAQGRPLSTDMSGAEEAPGPGDPDGSGFAFFTLNQGQGQICYELTVSDIAPATAAHIHIAPAGSPGPVVVPLAAPTSGSSSGCVDVDPNLIKAIRQNPENYYVNVHNAEYPGGAVRGQLSK